MRQPIHRNNDGVFLTIQQAAERVNLGTDLIRKLANASGSSKKIGRAYRIDIEKLIEYIRSL